MASVWYEPSTWRTDDVWSWSSNRGPSTGYEFTNVHWGPAPTRRESPFVRLTKRFPRMLPEFCAAELAPKRDEKAERGPETEPSRFVRFRTNRVGRAVGESWRVTV